MCFGPSHEIRRSPLCENDLPTPPGRTRHLWAETNVWCWTCESQTWPLTILLSSRKAASESSVFWIGQPRLRAAELTVLSVPARNPNAFGLFVLRKWGGINAVAATSQLTAMCFCFCAAASCRLKRDASRTAQNGSCPAEMPDRFVPSGHSAHRPTALPRSKCQASSLLLPAPQGLCSWGGCSADVLDYCSILLILLLLLHQPSCYTFLPRQHPASQHGQARNLRHRMGPAQRPLWKRVSACLSLSLFFLLAPFLIVWTQMPKQTNSMLKLSCLLWTGKVIMWPWQYDDEKKNQFFIGPVCSPLYRIMN